MEIRPADRTDLDALTDLRVAFIADVRGLDVDELSRELRPPTRDFLARHIDDGTLHSWLAVAGSEPVGAVSLLLYPVPPLPGESRRHDGYVLNMYVAPSHRRGGVGQALFDACTAGGDALGVRRLFLIATEAGRPLYERSGFTTNDAHLELRLARPC